MNRKHQSLVDVADDLRDGAVIRFPVGNAHGEPVAGGCRRMMLDTDRAAGRMQRRESTSSQSRRSFSAALAGGSGAVAAVPPLLLGSTGIVCATVALAMLVAVGLASFLI